MRIAVVHGYFLRGTGSNLFVANLCRELCKLGHEVQLICQEEHAEEWDFVASATGFSEDNQHLQPKFSRESSYSGNCHCFRPNLDRKLPVFVYDDYDGYSVKTFVDMNREEIEDYLDKNCQALKTIWRDALPDLVLSNHTVMQPVYVSRVLRSMRQVPHFATVHGSCLNFSIRNSSLIEEYAEETIEKVSGLIFVSQFSRHEFSEFFGNRKAVADKSRVIPAGVDVDQFKPLASNAEKQERLARLTAYISTKGKAWQSSSVAACELGGAAPDMWCPNAAAAPALLSAGEQGALMMLYYGKYLWTKGVHLPIAALPLVLQNHPKVRLVLTGFGAFLPYLNKMVSILHKRDEAAYIKMLSSIETECPGADPAANRYVQRLLNRLTDKEFARKYFSAAEGVIEQRVIFTGFLPHEYLRDLIALSDTTLAPSIFPEAFGLVAIEALASGVIPMQTNHSAFTEIVNQYKEVFRYLFPEGGLRTLVLDENLVLNMAGNMNMFMSLYSGLDDERRQEIRRRAREKALEFSWKTMASQYIQLA